MILSDSHLYWYLGIGPALGSLGGGTLPKGATYGTLQVHPLDPAEQIQPSSIDLRLGSKVTRFARGFGTVDASKGMPETDLVVEDRAGPGYITVRAGEFLLGHTLEVVTLPADLTARVEGRSSIGRLGVTMHVTAGYIDPGFSGQITLEIANLSARDVTIPVGHRCCQLVVETMSGPAARPYGHPDRNSKFQNQRGPHPFARPTTPWRDPNA